MNAPATRIRTRPQPACPLCHSTGAALHTGLRDRLYGVPGDWTIRCCVRPDCRLHWLDPVPTDADLPLTYTRYYTHGDHDHREGPRAWYQAAERGYHAWRFGYASTDTPLAARGLGALVALHPGRRAHFDLRIMGLSAARRGRLLDVGCGDGTMAALLAAYGWSVEGQEVDAAAAEAARRRGLNVTLGALTPTRFPAASFDVITLNHVLEHAADPRELLGTCRALLRPGGLLVAVTPNAGSLGHRLFGEHWRGLEPPRHLQVFTAPALARLASACGFRAVRCRSRCRARQVLAESAALARRQAPDSPAHGPPSSLWPLCYSALEVVEWISIRAGRQVGEELMLTATGGDSTP